ncbi:coatomer subunit alpha [Acrasis kona]|uniref:Coatomer subunit alpha n=1 Tax=Acrasis kona TaxID=1008807 RepID=A0AAW2ZP44_9EUKA
MTERYVYPSKQDLEVQWEAQKESETVMFRCRGMNDTSFNQLFNLMVHDDFGKMKLLDVGFNALSNESLFYLYALATKRNVSIAANDNIFHFESVKPKYKEFVEVISKPRIQTMNHMSYLSLSDRTKNAVFDTALLRTNDDLTKLEKLMVVLTDNVNKLSVTSKQHTDIFAKQHKQIEQKIADCLISRYGYSQISERIKGFDRETDVFFVSGDGKKIIIGEAKNELKMHAFGQVEERKEDFEAIPLADLPERLKNYEEVILLVGAEICKERFIDIAKQLKIVLARPDHDQFVIEDYSGRIGLLI